MRSSTSLYETCVVRLHLIHVHVCYDDDSAKGLTDVPEKNSRLAEIPL